MATKRWVVDASPLILLGKAGCLDLLDALADLMVIPQAVADEVAVKADGAIILQQLAKNPSYYIVDNTAVPPEIQSWDLGAGETQVITHGQRDSADRLVIDDLEARRCARALHLRVIGTLGIVGRAKAAGRLERAGPVIVRLRETGLYVSESIVRRLLREVGE
jgi:predicted nucleic acid-binding protein